MRKYLPLIKVTGVQNGMDLGCGRGEWIELLSQNGVSCLGVDLDEGMLSEAEALKLNVCRGDAIKALRDSESESLGLVSAFHLVEHIEFDAFIALAQNAYRALQPGGLLILETPNPDNFRVGTYSFYLDPTHRNPIPMELSKFTVEYAGFEECHALNLHPAEQPGNHAGSSLRRALSGTAQDYALVARKNGGQTPIGDLVASIDTAPSFADVSADFDRTSEAARDAMVSLQKAVKHQHQTIQNLTEQLAKIDRETSMTRRFTRPLTLLNQARRRWAR